MKLIFDEEDTNIPLEIQKRWEDGAFEVTQEDTISTRWISVPVTPKVENLPKSFGVSAPAFRHGFLLTS